MDADPDRCAVVGLARGSATAELAKEAATLGVLRGKGLDRRERPYAIIETADGRILHAPIPSKAADALRVGQVLELQRGLSKDERIHEAAKYVDHIRKVIAASARLGIGRMNTFVGRDWTKSVDDNWPRFLETWRPIIRFAEEHRVKVGIENCPMLFSKDEWPGGKNLATTPKIWRRMFEEIASDHFGLNYDAYTHFTSPIRRYPDLLVHRAIRSLIRSKRESAHVRRAGAASMPKARIYPYDEARLFQLGEQCSMTERRADEATRDVTNWLKCEYMRDRVGETFPGVISAVTGFGIFVELIDIYVEGLVHVTALPGDYYHFDPVRKTLSGERRGMQFRLGDRVRIIVLKASLEERKIDFRLVEDKERDTGLPPLPPRGQPAKRTKQKY